MLPSYNTAVPIELTRRPIWKNAAVAGVTVRTVWTNLEPTAGTIDWSYFDTAVQMAAAHGKNVGLSVAAGIYTPSWVYAAGANRFNFTLVGPWQAARATSMPEPWDPAFQAAWGTVISALGQRYNADPNVSFVMISGVGYDIESFYVKTVQDILHLDELGGPAIWLQGCEQIIDLYAAAFPDKPFILAMAPPTDGAPGIAWLRDLVEYGMQKYPGRFGVMYDGLNAVLGESVYQAAAVDEYSALGATGFQMVWSTVGVEGAERLQGTLGEALDRAVSLRAHWVEVYEVDCNNPAYAAELEAADQALEATAAATP